MRWMDFIKCKTAWRGPSIRLGALRYDSANGVTAVLLLGVLLLASRLASADLGAAVAPDTRWMDTQTSSTILEVDDHIVGVEVATWDDNLGRSVLTLKGRFAATGRLVDFLRSQCAPSLTPSVFNKLIGQVDFHARVESIRSTDGERFISAVFVDKRLFEDLKAGLKCPLSLSDQVNVILGNLVQNREVLYDIGLKEVGMLLEFAARQKTIDAGTEYVDSTSDQFQTLAQSLARCQNGDPQLAALVGSGIEVVPATHRLKTFKAVARCQGFINIARLSSNGDPPFMDKVRALFRQGKDLELAIFILEHGADESPRNSEVWEYLRAAYHAAGQSDWARLAARMNLVLQPGRGDSLSYLLSLQDKDGLPDLGKAIVASLTQ